MIRKIEQIKSFGVFEDFRWPAGLPEFKKFNLIYGWNYSGKTTLSRALRCFEKHQLHADFPKAQVQLSCEAGSTSGLMLPGSPNLLRVFNTDFVRENLAFDSGSASPILVLGAEDIAKQADLKAKKEERDELIKAKSSNETTRHSLETSLDKALSDAARDLIKNPLRIPNYDKKRFEPKVEACAKDDSKYILEDSALSRLNDVYRSSDKKSKIPELTNTLSALSGTEKKARSLLARVVTADEPIPRLLSHPEVEAWVEEGRALHETAEKCQFCGQRLPAGLLKQLASHFSKDYEDLMAELSKLIELLRKARKEQISLAHKSDFYPELAQQFAEQREACEVSIRARQAVLEKIETCLLDKQSKAFTAMVCEEVEDPTQDILDNLASINRTILAHNTRTDTFEKKRQEAFTQLERHYAASFAHDKQYKKRLEEIQELSDRMKEQGTKLRQLETDISSLEQELSEASKGAERINELLRAYFGKDDLRIVVSADKRFQIVRAGIPAKNLSEGEETAIAFAYFITRVQDGRNLLADTIVAIDDPVSSLDANHLFNTFALVKIQLASCRQLFISTHSYEFYSLLRDWVSDDEKDIKKPQTDWKRWSIFFLRRADDGNAKLEEIPKELLRFKSEYHYLFSTLYHFENGNGAGFDYLLTLPNAVRRFMEAFGGIMIPVSAGLNKKMDRLFPGEVERERVWKFINHYSHNTTITRSLAIPDTSECKAVVKACLAAVQTWDAEYYKDLESEVV